MDVYQDITRRIYEVMAEEYRKALQLPRHHRSTNAVVMLRLTSQDKNTRNPLLVTCHLA